MKRAIALIAAIMLLFSAIQLPVYASTNTRQGDVTISVDNVTSEAGSDVLVSVKINGQYDANILHLFLNYDADKVQLNGDLTKGPVWNSIEENNGYAVTNTAGSGKIGFIALLPQGTFNGTGTVFTASFHVSEDIAAGTVIPLNVSVSQFSNDALDGTSTAISFAAENGSITVPRPHAMEAVVSADRIEVEPGSEAEIAVSVTGDYQANILQLSVEFDAESVSLAADPISGAIWNAFTENGGYVATNTAEEGKIGFIAILPQGSVEDEGTVFTLRFTIADDVAAGTVLPITVTVDQFSYDGIDGTSSNVACTIENGSITIVTPVVETYTITYTINGEEYSTQTYEVGAAVIAPAYEVPEGYTFSGWDVPETMPAENLTLDASLTINTYTVVWQDWDGTVLDVQTVVEGQTAQAPADPVREGYTFTGWDTDFGCITGDTVVTALYEANEPVAVTLLGDADCNGAVNFSDISLIYLYLMGQGALSPQGVINSDFNCDGSVTFADVSEIYLFIIGG